MTTIGKGFLFLGAAHPIPQGVIGGGRGWENLGHGILERPKCFWNNNYKVG